MRYLLSLFLFFGFTYTHAQTKAFEGVLHYTITEKNNKGEKIKNSENNAQITMHVKGEKVLMCITQIIFSDVSIDTVSTYYLQDYTTNQAFIGMTYIDKDYMITDEIGGVEAGKFQALKMKTENIAGLDCNAGKIIQEELGEEAVEMTVWYSLKYHAPHVFLGQFETVPGLVTRMEERLDQEFTSVIELTEIHPRVLTEKEMQIPSTYTPITYEELMDLYPTIDETPVPQEVTEED